MINIIKITSFTLIIVFVGLFGFSLVIDRMASQHMSHVDCFGTNCGPIEHVVMHNYLMVDTNNEGGYIESYHQYFSDSDSLHQSPENIKESPPPKFFLV